MRERKREISEKELFEEMPVAKAVATLAVPTIISQVVTMIYNLADTFFVGRLEILIRYPCLNRPRGAGSGMCRSGI